MLTHLHINDFMLVDSLNIELNQGLTALTGETGAGKSLLLDALSMTIGGKTDADKVRSGCDKTDIQASFDLSLMARARKWLAEQDLGEENECILRRVITKEGRSRAYINGKTVTLAQQRTLGEMLIDIHSQHEHQSLLKLTTHRHLVDNFAGATGLAKQVKEAYATWADAASAYQSALSHQDEDDAKYQLLRYQVEELAQLELEENEVASLEAQQKNLSGAESAVQDYQHVLETCNHDDAGIATQLNKALQMLHNIKAPIEGLESTQEILANALVNVEEACNDLDRFIDSCEINPEKLYEIETRLSDIYTVARKHRVQPDQLAKLHQDLSDQLAVLKPKDELLNDLEQTVSQAQARYTKLACALSTQRAEASKTLEKNVNDQLAQLSMKDATFTINLSTNEQPNRCGAETVEFLISTQPQQPGKPLAKVASGGELSRISLAIQVAVASTSTIPTLVFDEVDVGIGGTTGDVVGRMLRQLGEHGQVFCVTHLAQVASKAHTHMRVEKQVKKGQVYSYLEPLEQESQVAEIARMMGGAVDSEQSLAHAREIIQAA